MKAQVKVPQVGESITEATISEWKKKSGEAVKRDDVILVLETDKASVEVVAETDGVLTTSAKAGEVVKIGATVGEIDSEGKGAAAAVPAPPPIPAAKTAAPPPIPAPAPASAPASASTKATNGSGKHADKAEDSGPAVRKIVAEKNINPASIQGTGKDGRLTKGDVIAAPAGMMEAATANARPAGATVTPMPVSKVRSGSEEIERVPMTNIRKRIAERLVQAQHTAAILTTFNEVDMSNLLALRAKYKDQFKEKYEVGLGFMGFFVKACVEALKEFPKVNAYIDGGDMIFHHYNHIGIAVGTERGLIVPVLKHAETMSLAEIELAIKGYAGKARDGKISIEDLSGGTFTITNGGVFGSLMSTPILNPPQSAILGMHKIEERPIAVNGQVVIRPMMYVALSYDHRIIDGSESVSFLVRVKECIEDPTRLLLEV
jgi:2-oxoglutarate dehydrogenase E2 component (dihydrolipoamide succinyltransferase)